jgi:hypothetical protein
MQAGGGASAASRALHLHSVQQAAQPMNQPKSPKREGKRSDSVVRLEDLAPREEVKGGARKRLFGQEVPQRPSRGRPKQ